jgi:S1-C subfamily serine protease
LRPEDVTYQIDTTPVVTVDELRRYLERLPDGKQVRVVFLRTSGNEIKSTEVMVPVAVPRR